MDKVRQYREALNMSQEELALAAGFNRKATISDLETGKSNPRLSTLKAVAEALKVRVIDLFDDAGDDPQAVDLYQRIMSLPEAQRDAFLTVLPEPPKLP